MKRARTSAIFLSLIMLFASLAPGQAQAAYPDLSLEGSENIFLAYIGEQADSDGLIHPQDWSANDLQPIVTHIDRSTGKADGEMFTNFLFVASAVKNAAGVLKQVGVSDESPADPTDWQTYRDELFAPGKNLHALADVAANNKLGKPIPIHVWIGLPYPNAKVFHNDTKRIASVERWIDSFLQTWEEQGFSSRLSLAGFYWTGESDYASGGLINDGYVMSAVNTYIHKLSVDGHPLHTLWIPYQGASGWDRWKSFGFDLSILQNNYYFRNASFETAAANAYENGQGMEMELDLGATWSPVSRAKFKKYLDSGVTGGVDSSKRPFKPYMKNVPLAWYVGGWYWYNGMRDHVILRLYQSGNPLYDQIWAFLKGTYQVDEKQTK
jgi:hypothetical protein